MTRSIHLWALCFLALYTGSGASQKCLTSVITTAKEANLTLFVEAVDAAGLTNVVEPEDAELTIFAPTDEAFVAALTALNLTKEEFFANAKLLDEVLSYHVLPTPYVAEELLSIKAPEGFVTFVTGGSCPVATVDVEAKEGSVFIVGGETSAMVLTPDVVACSSVIHVVDAVLVPCPIGEMDMPVEKETTGDATATATGVVAEKVTDPVDPVIVVKKKIPKKGIKGGRKGKAKGRGKKEADEEDREKDEDDEDDKDDKDDKDRKDRKDGKDDKGDKDDDKKKGRKKGKKGKGKKSSKIPGLCKAPIAQLGKRARSLNRAIQAAGLVKAVNSKKSSLTIFAPVDSAFRDLTTSLGISITKLLENEELLKEVIPFHVVKGKLTVEDIGEGGTYKTLLGSGGSCESSSLTVSVNATGAFIEADGGSVANIIETDLLACKSVIHFIDAVLVPCP